MVIKDGYLEVEDRPGLGIEFNEQAVLDHPYRAVDLYDLYREAFQLTIPKFEDPERP